MSIAVNSPKAFVLASRPKTLGAIICPILLGHSLAYAHGYFAADLFVAAMIAGLLLQISANLVNDYGDFIKGSDTYERLGPPRAMQMGSVTMDAMRAMITFVIVLAICCGFYLVLARGLIIVVLGLLGLLLALGYTLGARPLAYRGFSEPIIFVIFGPICVGGAYFVQTQTISIEIFPLALSSGALAAALLLTNNLRDMRQDLKTNKLTMALLLGENNARRIIVMLIIAASLGPCAMVQLFDFSPWLLGSTLVFILPAQYFAMILQEPISQRFNLMLASIGITLYLFSIVLSVAMIYG